MIAGVVASQGGLKILGNSWGYIGGSVYDQYENIGVSASIEAGLPNNVCPSIANVLSYINNNFPANTYELGTKVGFETFNVPVMFPVSCGIKVFEIKIKKWVFLDYYQSEPGSNVAIYNTSVTQYNAVSILEASYPAANTSVGSIGVVYDNNYYYECEVQYV